MEHKSFEEIRQHIHTIEHHRKELLRLVEDAKDDMEELIPYDRMNEDDEFEEVDYDENEITEVDEAGFNYNELKMYLEFLNESEFDTLDI